MYQMKSHVSKDQFYIWDVQCDYVGRIWYTLTNNLHLFGTRLTCIVVYHICLYVSCFVKVHDIGRNDHICNIVWFSFRTCMLRSEPCDFSVFGYESYCITVIPSRLHNKCVLRNLSDFFRVTPLYPTIDIITYESSTNRNESLTHAKYCSCQIIGVMGDTPPTRAPPSGYASGDISTSAPPGGMLNGIHLQE